MSFELLGHPVTGNDVWESSASENDPGLEQIVDSDSDAEIVRAVRGIPPEQSGKFGRVLAKGLIVSVINLQRYSNFGAVGKYCNALGSFTEKFAWVNGGGGRRKGGGDSE